jgi:hypothetical protein
LSDEGFIVCVRAVNSHSVLHPKSETRRGLENRGHSAVIMEMTDEQEKQV